ncbi:hypodermin-A [Manduca sexta]|uniref:hypodermin-A n=1 Tax=Manduca sexta TaxID=7130 RepID=UPI0018905675|nr:hypodermin-A [Manduca sexta]
MNVLTMLTSLLPYIIIVLPLNNAKIDRLSSLEVKEAKYSDLGDHTMVTDSEIFPYVAAILRRSTYISAGALIDENWVLTAADSLFLTRESLKSLRVRLGSINYKKGGILLPIKLFNIHPYFDDQRPVFDIALLMLPKSVRFTPTLRAIRLQKTSRVVAATHYLVTSWFSALNQNQSKPNHLESMDSIIRRRILSVSHLHPSDPDECADELTSLEVNRTDVVMCLDPGIKTDSCGRDTGAPVVLNGVLMGIVSSWKPADCSEQAPAPSFVTLISAGDVISWIHATVHGHRWSNKKNTHFNL